jgi:hypothetical protein
MDIILIDTIQPSYESLLCKAMDICVMNINISYGSTSQARSISPA